MPPTVEVAGAVPAGAVALVVAIAPGTGDPAAAKLGRGAAADLASFGADPAALLAVLAREKTKGNVGDVGQLPVGSRLVLAAGLGDGTPRDYRRAGAAIARRLKSVESAAITVGRRSNPAQVRALAEGLLLGGYSFKVTNSPKPETLTSITLVVDQLTDSVSDAVAQGVVTATASALARDYANTPSSTKSPAWLAKQAAGLARKSGLSIRVRDDRELRAAGFGGVIAVGMGSTFFGLLLLSVAHRYGVILIAAALVGLGSAVFHPESARIARLA